MHSERNTQVKNILERDWDALIRRHTAFWQCAETDRPLVVALYRAYQDTTLVAQACGEGELSPERIDPTPILAEYDQMAAAREQIGDDMVATGEALLGIPWLEAICGCRVMVPEGKSLWPEAPGGPWPEQIGLSEDNPWFQALVRVVKQVVAHAAGRYPVSMSHLRGPADILAALFGSQTFMTALVDEPERIAELARQAAEVYLLVAQTQERLIPAFRGGYAIRQFGLWSPERSVWLQDDTSSMISLKRYRQVFLPALARMSAFPYGVLHLHVPSLHLAETFAGLSNIRAINIYFDSKLTGLEQSLQVLRRLQEKKMPLVLAKEVYTGFSIEEYSWIIGNLSPRGLSVHLQAGSIEEGQVVMAKVAELHKKRGLR
jgi:hypothetical protein